MVKGNRMESLFQPLKNMIIVIKQVVGGVKYGVYRYAQSYTS